MNHTSSESMKENCPVSADCRMAADVTTALPTGNGATVGSVAEDRAPVKQRPASQLFQTKLSFSKKVQNPPHVPAAEARPESVAAAGDTNGTTIVAEDTPADRAPLEPPPAPSAPMPTQQEGQAAAAPSDPHSDGAAADEQPALKAVKLCSIFLLPAERKRLIAEVSLL